MIWYDMISVLNAYLSVCVSVFLASIGVWSPVCIQRRNDSDDNDDESDVIIIYSQQQQQSTTSWRFDDVTALARCDDEF